MSIGGIASDILSDLDQSSSLLTSEAVSLQTVFYSFLLDDRKRVTATTAAHSKHIMELLHNRKVLMTNKITI